MKYLLSFLIPILVIACAPSAERTTQKEDAIIQKAATKPRTQKPLQDAPKLNYAWKKSIQPSRRLVNTIAPPKGFARKPAPAKSFAQWLRYIPLKAPGTLIYLHNGQEKWAQGNHVAVIDIDTGKRDLQQCADAVMRLKAEYHYGQSEFESIYFNYTSGDKVAFEDWRKGKKPIVKGNKVSFSAMTQAEDNSYPNFKKYMNAIFNYAGTASLSKELARVELSDIQAGHVFIQGGFPGHAVIVMDVAENEQGEKAFLLAQSYMPAQDMHILKNPSNKSMSPWYLASEVGEELITPEWTFRKGDLKRWK